MAKVTIETRFPPCKGKRNRGARSPLNRCAVCGRAVRDRRSRLCPDCFAASVGGGCGAGACAGGECVPLDEKLVGADDGADVRTTWGEV